MTSDKWRADIGDGWCVTSCMLHVTYVSGIDRQVRWCANDVTMGTQSPNLSLETTSFTVLYIEHSLRAGLSAGCELVLQSPRNQRTSLGIVVVCCKTCISLTRFCCALLVLLKKQMSTLWLNDLLLSGILSISRANKNEIKYGFNDSWQTATNYNMVVVVK